MTKKISELPAGSTPDGTELVEAVQGGGNVSLTVQQIADRAVGVGGGGITAINEQTGTTYTLVLGDATKAVRCTNASAITLTVPTNASVALPPLCIIPVIQGGAGAVTIAAASGVTLESPNGAVTTAVGDFRMLFQRAANVWVIG